MSQRHPAGERTEQMKYIAAIEGEEYLVGIGENGEVSLNDAPRAVDLESIDDLSHFSLLMMTT